MDKVELNDDDEDTGSKIDDLSDSAAGITFLYLFVHLVTDLTCIFIYTFSYRLNIYMLSL